MMNQMSPGQQQKFLGQTVDLRKQMMEKRFAYMEAMRNPDTTPQDLAKIEKEMLDLRSKMMDTMNSLQGQVSPQLLNNYSIVCGLTSWWRKLKKGFTGSMASLSFESVFFIRL